MKWQGRRQSDNFEDRRGLSTTGKVAVGGGAIGLILLLIQVFFGSDAAYLAQNVAEQVQSSRPTQVDQRQLSQEEIVVGEFVSTVLASTEDTWNKIFRENNMRYREPKMVLFSEVTTSACGGASGSTGPFYCPADETLYMDMSFFNILRTKFGAQAGEFAIAYAIAHEVGHHVQHLLGILEQTHNMRRNLNEAQANQVQVATELQADYFAGVWAHYEKQYLDKGDIEDAMNAAAAIGDDNIQKRTQGYTRPETYTHGTSQQRVTWFGRGYDSGDISQGDTFGQLLN